MIRFFRRTVGMWVGIAIGLLLPWASLAAAVAVDPSVPPSQAAEPPRLVVFLVVDQLRGDLLERYSSLFTGGFRRLMEEGLSFTNALHDHAQTETAPGHATLSTGVYPTRAGIPANVWREADESGELQRVENVVDSTESLTGISGLPGSSPRALRRTGLADWVLAADEDAKVVSISVKDRAAILLAGKSAGEVFWFDSRVGRFVTSTYYRSRNPSWLDDFNEDVMTEYAGDSVWVSTIPAEAASLSAPDTAGFEGDGEHTFFPHRFHEEVFSPGEGDIFFWLENTPFLDRATLDIALKAMAEENLGQVDGRTDFLAISFSQTDYVGHAYGPLSREQMDNLLRLDKVLEDLLSVLDEEVGRENYLVGFSSDHGTATSPERNEGNGLRLTDVHRSGMVEALTEAQRTASLRPTVSTTEAFLDALGKLPFVGPAYSQESLVMNQAADSFAVLFRHSFTPGRGAGMLSRNGIEMSFNEGVLPWGTPFGSTHGTPFYYDRWVPLILMGPGIQDGVENRPVRPMDLAPTLALLAGIPFPDDLDGRPLIPKRN